MSDKNKNTILEDDLENEMLEEIEQLEEEQEMQEEKKANENSKKDEKEDETENKTKIILAKTLADFDNFKKRVERDKDEMIFFLKADIFKKILPRLDDMDRIIKNTPEELKENALFEWILSMQKKLLEDLAKMWVKPFDSVWEIVNPDFHDVMTVIPGKESWVIVEEFEKWYLLEGKVLRHSKVIAWA